MLVKFDYSENFAQLIIDEIGTFVNIVTPRQKISLIKEKVDDNRILECALAAKADYLITGDKKHLLPLKKINGCRILSARDFMETIIS